MGSLERTRLRIADLMFIPHDSVLAGVNHRLS